MSDTESPSPGSEVAGPPSAGSPPVESPAAGSPRRPRGVEIFDGPEHAPSVFETGAMSMPTMEPEATEQLMEFGLSGGNLVRTLFELDGDPPVSLSWVWFGPDLVLPRHSHDSDCLYVVVAGELTMGSRTIRPGGGFFVPADAPYAYRAGPEGVQVLEFRNALSFGMHITEGLGRWERIVEVARENGDRWRAEAEAFGPGAPPG